MSPVARKAGCVNPEHEGMGDIARWAALAAGFPDSVPSIALVLENSSLG
jgi:acetyl-CoA acetyltransferase